MLGAYSLLDDAQLGLLPGDRLGYGTSTLRLASGRYVTGAADTPPHTEYAAVVKSWLAFDRRVEPGLGANAVALGLGDLVFDNTDGGFDAYRGFSVDGRRVAVRLVDAAAPIADAGTVLVCVGRALTFSEAECRLAVQDPSYRLDVPLQATLYAGSGGLEGGNDVQGKPKPLLFGECYAITPAYLGPIDLGAGLKHTYQYHDGAAQGVLQVYDKGYPTGYTDTPAQGVFQLAATPAGLVTCDAQGSKLGGTYVSTVAAIGQRLVLNHGPQLASDDLDATAWTELAADQAGTAGIYFDAPVNAGEALGQLLRGVHAYHGYSRAGLLQARVLKAPAGTPAYAFHADEILEAEVLLPPDTVYPPPWRWRVGWKRCWTAQSTDLATLIADAERAFLAEEYRVAVAGDATVKDRWPQSVDPPLVPSPLLAAADAQALAAALLALYRGDRMYLRIRTRAQALLRDLGDVVSVTYPRFGLALGRLFTVLGMSENGDDGSVDLTLFG